MQEQWMMKSMMQIVVRWMGIVLPVTAMLRYQMADRSARPKLCRVETETVVHANDE
jgi:hypothetical protein